MFESNCPVRLLILRVNAVVLVLIVRVVEMKQSSWLPGLEVQKF